MVRIYYLTMNVNIFEAKARLSELIEAARAGTRVTICRRNRPVAELVGVGSARAIPRPVGGARGRFVVPPIFFEPLPEVLIGAFYPDADPTHHPAVAAERSPEPGAPKPRVTPRGRKARG